MMIANTIKIGVQITNGSKVKWNVVNPPETIARITTPTANILIRKGASNVRAATYNPSQISILRSGLFVMPIL